jgi:hypothetical protein
LKRLIKRKVVVRRAYAGGKVKARNNAGSEEGYATRQSLRFKLREKSTCPQQFPTWLAFFSWSAHVVSLSVSFYFIDWVHLAMNDYDSTKGNRHSIVMRMMAYDI